MLWLEPILYELAIDADDCLGIASRDQELETLLSLRSYTAAVSVAEKLLVPFAA